MANIAIIPARGGSRRIPGKNKRLFHGKPIIEYSIEAARGSCLFDEIVVSTDDDDIINLAFQLGVTGLSRREGFEVDQVGTQEVARSVLQQVEAYEIACVIYATAPLLSPIDLAQGLADLHESRKAFAYSVGPEENVYNCPYYQDAGQFYWGHSWAFLGRVPLYRNSKEVRIEYGRTCDINTEEDWQRAERMYAALQERR